MKARVTSIGLIAEELPENLPSVVDNQAMIGTRLTNSLFVIAAGLAITNACGQVNYDFERLGYDNVTVRVGDGCAGWPEHAPFDAIIVTAAPDKVPQPLIDQLTAGGRMVIPVGPRHDLQVLQRLTKEADGEVTVENISAVRFVPFTRDPEKE